MSFSLSSLFDTYSSNPKANRYLQNLSNDAQAGGITPAQYLLATEMLKHRGYRGF